MNYTLLLLGLVIVAAGCATQSQITSFAECAAAGNPIMESYPRQCRADGRTFVEEINDSAVLGAPELVQCGAERPEACTLDYNPVCALRDNGIRCFTTPCQSFDAVTMGNACSACSDAAVFGHYPGSCEENRFVVCKENRAGFDAKISSDSGWICVDICPRNYDPYITQIGAEMCILHYGTEEISKWEVCGRSSESCSCVKAYETTNNELIENPDFRCVPQQYAERLLFRSGQERLDEEGRLSAVIA